MNKKLFGILILLISLLVGCTPDEAIHTKPAENTNVIIKGKTDGYYAPVALDETSKTLQIIDFAHHEVHEGDYYSVSDTVNCSSSTVKWQVTTANTTTYAHFVFDLTCTGEATFLVTEGSDRTNGTALAEVNRRRVPPVSTAATVVTRTPTGGTTDGATILFSRRNGITGVAGKSVETAGARDTSEWILAPGTKYVISVTTYADVFVSVKLDWYEHEDESY